MDEFNRELALILSGALVAQVVNWLQAYHNKHKLKGLILEELKQLRVELDRVAMGLERQLQIYGKKGLDSQTYVAIRAFIFDNHYTDVMTSFTMDQRISLQMIHSYLSAINEMFEEQQSMVRAIFSKVVDDRNEHDIDNWGEHIQGLYVTSHAAIWHINHHLNKPKKPTLVIGDKDHQNYLQTMEAATNHAKEFIKAGAFMDRDSFEKIYDPTTFESGFENTRSE